MLTVKTHSACQYRIDVLQSGPHCGSLLSMFFLSCTLFPLAFIYYLNSFEDHERHDRLVSFLCALPASFVAVLVRIILHTFIPQDQASFIVRLVQAGLFDVLLPLSAAYALLAFFIQVSFRRRIELAIAKFFGMLTVYAPVLFYIRTETPDIWLLVYAPLTLLALLFLSDFLLSRRSGRMDVIDLLQTLWPSGLVVAVYIFLSTWWFYGGHTIVLILGAFAVIIPVVFLRVRTSLKRG